jgi:hypothetical protein
MLSSWDAVLSVRQTVTGIRWVIFFLVLFGGIGWLALSVLEMKQ